MSKKKPAPEQPKKFHLNESEAMQVHLVNRKVVDVKCRLANLVIQQLQTAQDVTEAEKELVDKINEVAANYGITAENAGSWNFDLKTMTFSPRQ